MRDLELIRDFLFHIEQWIYCVNYGDIFFHKIKNGSYNFSQRNHEIEFKYQKMINDIDAAVNGGKLDEAKSLENKKRAAGEKENSLKRSLDEDIHRYLTYQIDLMIEAGFFREIGESPLDIYTLNGKNFTYGEIRGLSNYGHDYINNIRENELWNKIKTEAKNMSLNAFMDIATKLGKSYIEKKFGIAL